MNTFAVGCPSNVQGERGSPIVLLQSLQCTKPRPMPSELVLFRPHLDLRVNPKFLATEDAELLLLHWMNSLLAPRPVFEVSTYTWSLTQHPCIPTVMLLT